MIARRLFTVAAVLAASLAGACGGIPTVSRDGYRALVVFGPVERYSIAVRAELRRVEGEIGGSRLIKILRPDLGKVWQFRPSTRRVLEEKWDPSDEIVPAIRWSRISTSTPTPTAFTPRSSRSGTACTVFTRAIAMP